MWTFTGHDLASVTHMILGYAAPRLYQQWQRGRPRALQQTTPENNTTTTTSHIKMVVRATKGFQPWTLRVWKAPLGGCGSTRHPVTQSGV